MSKSHKREQRGRRTGAEVKALLRRRARELAEIPPSAEQGETVNVVVFCLAKEDYAIESRWVREVLPLRSLTPLPGTPGFVLGIINVHGRIVSVVDLKRFFELPGRGLTDKDNVIIISDGDMEFGVLAERIQGVRSVPVRSIQTSLPTLTGIREKYLLGVTTDPLVILDAAKVLHDDKILVNDQD